MIYYIDIPSRDTDGLHTVSAHAAVENVLARIGPVVRQPIRIAEQGPAGIMLRSPGYRYTVAVTPEVNFILAAQAIVRESGLRELTIGFRADETYSRITAEKIEEVARLMETVPLANTDLHKLN